MLFCKNRSDLCAGILHSADEDYWEQCWLCSLTAAGRKDLRYLSFTHLGCISLLLKELPSAEIVSCRGWDSCTSSDDSSLAKEELKYLGHVLGWGGDPSTERRSSGGAELSRRMSGHSWDW